MPLLLNIIFAIGMSILDVAGMLMFLYFFFPNKSTQRRTITVAISCVVIQFVAVQIVQNTTINLLTTMLCILTLSMLFECSPMQKVFALFMEIMTVMPVDAIGSNFCLHFGICGITNGSDFYVVDPYSYFLLTYLSKILLMLFFWGLRKLFDLPYMKLGRGVKAQYAMMLGISTLCCIINVVTNQLYLLSRVEYALCTFINAAMIAINIFVYMMYYQMWRIYCLTLEKEAIENEFQYKQTYFSMLEAHQQEIRSIRHDMKNRLIGITSSLQDPETAREEIRSIMEEISVSEQLIFSENPAVNAVLNVKLETARNKRIESNIDIKVPANLDMPAGDIGVLLGNLLDNAIEAAEKCAEGKRKIWLSICLFHKSLIISCTNSTPNRVISLHTTKEDPSNHGIGLKSIDKIITKYHGERHTHIDVDRFHIEVNLWL